MNVGVLVGSLRKAPFNGLLANALTSLAPSSLKLDIVPEVYVSHVDKLFDEHGKLGSDGTRKFLQEFMQTFANWAEAIRSQDKRV
jgi:NAD(P)H-dependent FMN reductase